MAPKKRPNFRNKQHIVVTDSSLVERVYYDPKSRILDAVFHSHDGGPGKRYRYFGVTALVFAEFVVDSSMGTYFNEHIKNRYEYKKVPNR